MMEIQERIKKNLEIKTKECITNGCKSKIYLASYWKICVDCYRDIPDHIPTWQANLYSELKAEKEKDEISNDN